MKCCQSVLQCSWRIYFQYQVETGQESKSTMKTLTKFPGSVKNAFGSRTTRQALEHKGTGTQSDRGLSCYNKIESNRVKDVMKDRQMVSLHCVFPLRPKRTILEMLYLFFIP